MAIVVGDIHGNVDKVERFLAHRPDQPHVALGDYVDSFRESFESQVHVVELLAASDTVMLWGNHDLHYLSKAPWRSSGYQHRHADRFRLLFDDLLERRRLVAAHWADGWLCTHAGFAEGGWGLTPGGCCRGNSHHLADCINEHFFACLAGDHGSPIFNVPVARGGRASYGGIFWLDPFREKVRLDPAYRQLFGHTEQKEPVATEHWVCLDTTNADDIWVFDTESETLSNLRTEQELRERRALLRHKEELARMMAANGGL